jgi:hypothetical protein
MPTTRRTQPLMDPEEFRRLHKMALRKKTSVAELIRSAVREVYFTRDPERGPTIEAILAMRLPKITWKRAKKEIEVGHADVS